MKTLLKTVSASIASLAFSAPLALADGCTLNGQEVDCAQVQAAAGQFLALGAGFFIVMGLAFLAATVFWIMMLIHAATHDNKDKAMWIILMVFTGFIGAIIYYFVVKKNSK